MLEWMQRNWKGYVRISLHGYSPERFFNLCSARGIKVWDIRAGKDGNYEFYMTVEGYRRVKPLVRKAGVRLRIRERRGLPFFIYRNKRRGLYAWGLCSFFLVLFLMSLFLWDIQFQGNVRYTDDALLHYLDTRDIRYGMRKSNVRCEDLEADIRASFPEIIWVSARVSGTRLLVHVKENEVLSSIPPQDDTPCDIVAGKKGRIDSIVVRQGIAMVKAGDDVEEGQVLVSGRVPVTGDNEEEIRAYFVPAQADILARTGWQYEKKLPLVRTVRIPSGRRRQGWYVKAGAWSFLLLTPVMGQAGQWDYSMDEHQLRIFSDFYLPIYMGNIQGREMVSYEKKYSDPELKQIAKTINNQFVEKLEEKGVQILENNDRIEKNISGYRIKGQLATVESIVSTRPLSEETTDSEETKTAQ